MLTREEYKKTYIRMMDSNRIYCKGSHSCDGVSCGKCPLHSLCEETESDSFHSFEIIEAVEQWGKKHPVVTNREKWKEVFGSAKIPVCFKANREDPCDEHGCSCIRCKYGVNGEYHAPECVNK